MEGNQLEATVRVVVCDPNPLTREGLAAVLDRDTDITVAGCAATVHESTSLAEEHRPAVMVVSHDPSAFDGIELARLVGPPGYLPPISTLLLVTGSCDDELLCALQAGVLALLPKDTALPSLSCAIRSIASGSMVLGLPQAVCMMRRLANRSPSVGASQPARLGALTERELDVLRLVASGHSNQVIAKELSVSEATVKSHLYHLSRKLNLSDRTQAAILAYETGLVRASQV